MVASAAAAGKSLIPASTQSAAPIAMASAPISNLPAFGLIAIVSAFFGLLLARRPGGRVLSGAALQGAPLAMTTSAPTTSGVAKAPQPVAQDPHKTTMMLQLARIEPRRQPAQGKPAAEGDDQPEQPLRIKVHRAADAAARDPL